MFQPDPRIPPYETWFAAVTEDGEGTQHPPHPWQVALASESTCRDQLIRIPTGFGKTAGTVLAWLYHRVQLRDGLWPTRLAFCLPMRTLVEQTHRAIADWLDRAALRDRVGLHLLMGGVEASEWRLTPAEPALLVGTQDMLLSRALNRGYGASRGAWPVEFGLLHHDTLWVCDEVQLQDVGLATSAQLAAFRARERKTRGGAFRESHTWWMSATLQPQWLETVDHAPRMGELRSRIQQIPQKERTGGLWNVRKALQRQPTDGLAKPEDIARLGLELHSPGTLTLVVVNTVKRAAEVFDTLGALTKGRNGAPASTPELCLVHSRFRGVDRRRWNEFLARDSRMPDGGRIIVATQVVEAGVDISAGVLITDLAPWPSLVQRFGRVARYEGETGRIVVVGGAPEGRNARPYEEDALQSASEFLDRLVEREGDGSPAALERFEEALSVEEVRVLYPYTPRHVLRRRDLDGLFDTSADLSGADVDVSRFIRSGEETDVLAFWRELEPDSETVRPHRDELCPVPIGEMKEWLAKGGERKAYRMDYVSGEWQRADPSRLAPGVELLIRCDAGGYSELRGWSPAATETVKSVESAPGAPSAEDLSNLADDSDPLSENEWKTIAVHGRETGQQARRIARELNLGDGLGDLLDLAGRWHDVGKAHEVFASAIREDDRAAAGALGASRELAKAPKHAWKRPPYPERPGFRHELASLLALFELLRRFDSMHPALLGPHRELLTAIGAVPEPVADGMRVDRENALACEVAALSAEAFDLLAWLVCTHHGKVRCVLSPTLNDQSSGEDRIHGIKAGDRLPTVVLALSQMDEARLPELELSLDLAELGLGARYGASWAERVGGLLAGHGPFKLAYLEALLRAADVRASRVGGVPDGGDTP